MVFVMTAIRSDRSSASSAMVSVMIVVASAPYSTGQVLGSAHDPVVDLVAQLGVVAQKLHRSTPPESAIRPRTPMTGRRPLDHQPLERLPRRLPRRGSPCRAPSAVPDILGLGDGGGDRSAGRWRTRTETGSPTAAVHDSDAAPVGEVISSAVNAGRSTNWSTNWKGPAASHATPRA